MTDVSAPLRDEEPPALTCGVFFDNKFTVHGDYDTALVAARATAAANPDKLVRLYVPAMDLRASLTVDERPLPREAA